MFIHKGRLGINIFGFRTHYAFSKGNLLLGGIEIHDSKNKSMDSLGSRWLICSDPLQLLFRVLRSSSVSRTILTRVKTTNSISTLHVFPLHVFYILCLLNVTLTKACLRCNIKLTKVKENIPQPHSSHQQGKVSGVGSNPNKASQNPLNDDDLSIQCIQPGFAATFNFWCMFPSVVCSALLFLYHFKISRANQMLLFLIYKYVERRCYFFLF